MKAIVISRFVDSYSDLTITDIPEPIPKKRSEILVNVHFAAINFVDLLYARGTHQNNTALVRPPFTLGLEFAGTVAYAPPCSIWKSGDRVFGAGLGAFAEKIVAKEGSLHAIPAGWDFEDAAGLGATAPVSYGALVERGRLKAGETVLVHAGAGGLGVMAVQIAKALGARVVVTVGSGEKTGVARRTGADVVVDYSVDGWEKIVVGATKGEGVDVVFDSVGLVGKSLRCLKHGGRVLVVGFAGSEGGIEKVAMNRILLKQAQVIGYRYGETDRMDPEETKRVWSGLKQLIAQGFVKPVVFEETYSGLEDVPRAMRDLADRKVWGKAVVRISPSQEPKPKL
ncbi:MAG: hypothetical protein M1830_006642 [Pleopsidium flavum]|nr:MAG: hypothetical protein M1830_006642 [Pleopsidium flavum]